MDHVENITEYHDVVASSTRGIINAITQSDAKTGDKVARALLLFNIRQAFVLYRHENDDIQADLMSDKKDVEKGLWDELKAMKLEDKTIDELEVIMFSFQARAGIKPVQSYKTKARTFEMMRDEL